MTIARAAIAGFLTLSAAAHGAEARATLLHTAPSHATSGEQLQIDGSLAPGNEPIKKVTLRFRGPNDEYADANMELQYGDLYRGFIPGRAVKFPAVEYYIEGIAADGARVALFMTAARPAKVQVGKEEGTESADNPYGKPTDAVAEKGTSEKAVEKPEKEKPGRGKKNKRGKGRIDETPAESTPEVAEAEKEPEPRRKEPPAEKEPAREEPREEPAPEPKAVKRSAAKERAERDAARRTERERRRQEMEEELKVYSAEDSAGAKVKNDRESTKNPRLVQIITARQLKQLNVRTVMEALDLTQGITISRSISGFYQVAVRGIRGDADVLFLYDGHPMNDLYDGKALSELPIETIDHLEITRGPMPVTAGAGAVLMMVNLVPNREPGIRAQFSGGTFNRPPGSPRSPFGFDGSLSGAAELGALKLSLDGAVWAHNGYIKPVQKDSLDVDTIKQGMRATGDPAGLTNDQNLRVNIGAGAEFKHDALGELVFRGRFLLENRAALIGLFDAVGNDSRLSWTQVLLDLGWKKKLSELITLSAKVGFDQRNTKRTWQLSPRDFNSATTGTTTAFPEGIIEEERVGQRSFGLSVQGELSLPFHNQLVAGLGYDLQAIYDYAYLTNYDTTPTSVYTGSALQVWHGPTGAEQKFLIVPGTGVASRSTIGLFIGDTWRPVEQLAIDVGLRLDFTQLPTSDGAGNITGSSFAPFFGPRVALSFAATPGLLIKVSYGRMLRNPTVSELAQTVPDSVSNQGRFIGNPALKPETTNTVEAGFDWMQGFGDARLKLHGSVFFTSISDAIHQVDPTGNLVPITNRTNGVFVFGADGEARLDVGRMGAFVNASWFRAQDNGTPQSGYLLTDTPQVRLNIGTSVPLGPWFAFDLTLRYGSERRNDQRSTLELLRRYTLPAYAIVGAQIRTEPIFDHVELAISGSNIFDFQSSDDAPRMDATRTPGGVPREGWGAWATIRGWY